MAGGRGEVDVLGQHEHAAALHRLDDGGDPFADRSFTGDVERLGDEKAALLKRLLHRLGPQGW